MNVNQSNYMSAQQGISSPTVGVSRELHSCTFTKRNNAPEATSAPPCHPSQKRSISEMSENLHKHLRKETHKQSAPCLQAKHTTKPAICYCRLCKSLFLDPWCFWGKFFRLLQEKIQAGKQRAHSAGLGQWEWVCCAAAMPYFRSRSHSK